MKKANAWICAPPTTDHDSAIVIPDKKRKSVTIVIRCGPNVFGINKFRNIFLYFRITFEMVFELDNDLHL